MNKSNSAHSGKMIKRKISFFGREVKIIFFFAEEGTT